MFFFLKFTKKFGRFRKISYLCTNKKIKNMAKLVLEKYQIPILQKLAKASHMDNWFNLDDDGVLRDRESNNRIMSIRNGCKQLMDGLTPEDLECLNYTETYLLLSFVGNELKSF